MFIKPIRFSLHITCLYIDHRMCVLGNRLLSEEHSGNCTKEEGSPLWNLYCNYTDVVVEGLGGGINRTVKMPQCDSYFESHNTTLVKGIPGLASGAFLGITHVVSTLTSSPAFFYCWLMICLYDGPRR